MAFTPKVFSVYFIFGGLEVPDFKAAGGIRLQFKKSSDVPIWHGSKPFESTYIL
jgi:hypothetical protein